MITLVYLCAFGKIQFEPNLYWPHFSHSRLYIVWLCHNASVAAVLLLSLLLFLLSFWFVFVDGTFYNNDHIENKFEENFLLAVLVIACSAENIDVSLFMDVGWHKNWARVRNVGKSMPKRSCVSKFYVRRKHTQLKLARTFSTTIPNGKLYVLCCQCKLQTMRMSHWVENATRCIYWIVLICNELYQISPLTVPNFYHTFNNNLITVVSANNPHKSGTSARTRTLSIQSHRIGSATSRKWKMSKVRGKEYDIESNI